MFLIARLTSSTYVKVCESYLTKNEEATHKTDHQQGFTEEHRELLEKAMATHSSTLAHRWSCLVG